MSKPTNISLLDPKAVKWGLMKPVTVTDTFEGQTNNLHNEGLYSSEIFGRPGTKERDTTLSYVDIKINIFNPTYFYNLVKLKSLYGDIIKGKQYAVWDESSSDFIKSNVIEGDTGYTFFISHFGELSPLKNESSRRKKGIDFFNEYKDVSLSNKVLIIPAGIRDIEFDPNGNTTENEVNDKYRKLIFRSNSLNLKTLDETDPVYDNIRWGLQDAFNGISDYFFDRLKGKKGFPQRKVGTRGVFNSSRNVITARKLSVGNIDRDRRLLDPNSVFIGMYQSLLMYSPLSIYCLTNGLLSKVFTPNVDMARLVSKKNGEGVYVEASSRTVEKWTSADGLQKIFNGFGNPQFRNRPIIIDNHYLALICIEKDKICVVQDINDLPEGFNKDNAKALTYMELFYLECSYEMERKLAQLTRYPIEGLGSIFPAKPIIMPLSSGCERRTLVDEQGDVIREYPLFPIGLQDPIYFDGMSISNTKLAHSGGDMDGDQYTANSLMGEDTIEEAYKLFGSRDYYIGGADNFQYGPTIETHEFLLRALTIGALK